MQHAHTLNGRHLLDTGSARRRCSFHRRRSRQATMVRPPEPSPAASRRPAPTWARPCAPPVWLVAGRRLRICPARTGRCLRTRGHRDRARGAPLPAACAPAGVLHSRRRSSSRVPCLRGGLERAFWAAAVCRTRGDVRARRRAVSPGPRTRSRRSARRPVPVGSPRRAPQSPSPPGDGPGRARAAAWQACVCRTRGGRATCTLLAELALSSCMSSTRHVSKFVFFRKQKRKTPLVPAGKSEVGNKVGKSGVCERGVAWCNASRRGVREHRRPPAP